MSLFNEENLSDWQTGAPELPGVYEIKTDEWEFRCYSKWNGKTWCHVEWGRINDDAQIENAIKLCRGKTTQSHWLYGRAGGIRWRGLKFDPKEAK